MIKTLLVANRGEIARRVFRTCRTLGIATVAVHSDADASALFVREADAAVRLPGHAPAETYLRGDLVIEAARAAGADAIHPGYGFLSENAEFAAAVIEAGLTWVGPDPDAIARMGSKVESKKLMEAAGVPVLGNLTPETATEADLPLLVKASAGGGGRGMRIVRRLGDLADEIAKAAAEAESAFGDGTVFVEPYVESGRHVEVQVVGERGGEVVVFGERDCSVQRRHQKVIEEAPAPGLPAATRAALHEAARRAASAIDYVGAGTVEFLYDPASNRFFFLEMNTRLQVEHPVTEEIFGVDLVALQLAVAEGGRVTPPGTTPPQEARPHGHAIEVRLYAEDPAAGFAPQTGLLTAFDIPGVRAQFELAGGLRLDSGVAAGDEIGTFYDAMIAKVVVHAATREQAARQLAGALERARIHGLRTNRDLLVGLLRSETFLQGRMSTTWLDDAAVVPGLLRPLDQDRVELAAFAAALALAERARAASTYHARIPVAWRNVVSQPQTTDFAVSTAEGEQVSVRWYGGRTPRHAERDDVVVVAAGPDEVALAVGGVVRTFAVSATGEAVDVDSSLGHVALRRLQRFTDPADRIAAGSLLAPMPGSVVAVHAGVGDEVAEGQPLLVLEAMKMQHTIAAPHAGTVTEIDVAVGDQVNGGAVLAVVDTVSQGTVEEESA
ncbi:biotin carboxylase N-terminal domain-containing protein [Nocardioides sp. BP30]|uniref:acetyl/propionyl/methylcrotonyl-CoA carboxylase subunit alpha n=1 Tax=Nocardioides sp. BP30 TaxID=3036374 RepID=UPI002468B077|nr:biotin carboxylase N-terminal domain-containing protein [Nocardioides sp. BP30]WGL52724.1 biotin carboxylase N-terminal domain-containing protein [Nocardioides sp. BP30]